MQGAVISDRFPALVKDLAHQFAMFRVNPAFNPESDTNTPIDCTDWRLLRVVTHVLIALQFANHWPKEGPDADAAGEVLGGYIRMLAAATKYNVIPLYAARLPPDMAVHIMGEVMLHVQDDKTRNDLIHLFKIHNLDIQATLKRTMENALTQTEEHYKHDEMPTNIALQLQYFPEQRNKIGSEDDRLIRTLEWMLLVPNMKDDLVTAAIVLYKRFYCTFLANSRFPYRPSVLLG